MNECWSSKGLMLALLLCANVAQAAADELSKDVFTSSALKVLSYNICTEARTFGTELDIEHRLSAILKIIKESNPNIICLQEVRSKVAETVAALLSANGYRTHYSSNNGGEMSLGLMTAYKPDLFLCESHKTQWFSETPNECSGNEWYPWGRIYTIAKLRACLKGGMPDTSKDSLWIINTHLGLKEEEKEYSAKQLLAAMAVLNRAVLVGDMNFFDDKQGLEQRKMYTDAGLLDLLAKKVGTFSGYSYDGFIPKTKATLSKLDGAFTKGIKQVEATVLLYDELEDDLSNRDEMPSDHLPILLRLAKL
ncbi:MAG: endonuclease/exonuclease/phosphatase family protein [Candidatus Dependentiae bacterium]